MRKNYTNSIMLVATWFLLGGCALDTAATEDQTGEVRTTQAAWTGSNPTYDADFVCELPSIPGVTYLDIAVKSREPYSPMGIFLTRSDGQMERRGEGTYPNCPVEAVWATQYDHMKFVSLFPFPVRQGKWGYLASSNTNKKIYINAILYGNPPLSEGTGSFPGGVDSINWITGWGQTRDSLSVYIDVSKWDGTHVIRKGAYNRRTPNVITWDPFEYPANVPTDGLVVAQPAGNGFNLSVFNMVDYTTSQFTWRMLDSLGTLNSEQHLLPVTDHAYIHPEGCVDRFSAEGGLDWEPTTDYFWALDRYADTGPYCPGGNGRQAQVIAKLGSYYLRP